MRRALCVLAVVTAATAWADKKHPNPFLSQAKAFFTQGDGDKCLKRLLQASDKWKHNDKHDMAEIELYGGMCGYLTGEQQAAEVSFQRALQYDPKIQLPADAGAGIENLWAKVTGKPVPISSSKPQEKQAEKTPEKQPDRKEAKDTKVAQAPPPNEPPPPPKPYVAENKMTPDQQLDAQLNAEASSYTPKKSRSFAVPVVLGVGAIGAGIAGIVLGLQAKSLQNEYNDPNTFQMRADSIRGPAQTDALVTNILFAAAGALLIGTIAILVFGS
jgi:hypothetical protein